VRLHLKQMAALQQRACVLGEHVQELDHEPCTSLAVYDALQRHSHEFVKALDAEAINHEREDIPRFESVSAEPRDLSAFLDNLWRSLGLPMGPSDR